MEGCVGCFGTGLQFLLVGAAAFALGVWGAKQLREWWRAE